MRKNAFKFSRSDIEWCALLAHKTYLQKKMKMSQRYSAICLKNMNVKTSKQNFAKNIIYNYKIT